MRKPFILGLIVAGVAVAIVLWLRAQQEAGPGAAPARGSGSATVTGSASTGGAAMPAVKPPPRVRRLDAEERRQLGDRIAAARERARAAARTAGGPAPTLGDDTIRLEQVGATVQAALQEAIPILAACYGDKPAGATAKVAMTMISDPDLGTVIDTEAMRDSGGAPLTPELDDCLRTAIESLALPPLEVGGNLPLEYSFVFD